MSDTMEGLVRKVCAEIDELFENSPQSHVDKIFEEYGWTIGNGEYSRVLSGSESSRFVTIGQCNDHPDGGWYVTIGYREPFRVMRLGQAMRIGQEVAEALL